MHFLSFLGQSGDFGDNKKPRNFSNTYRMKLALRQLYSIVKTLQLGCKFGTCPILEKKRG